MSVIVVMELSIVAIDALIGSLMGSGLSHQSARELRTEDGKVHRVDLVVTDEQGTQVGVRVDHESGQATFVGHERGEGRTTALVNRIAQRYAHSRVLEELKRKGYQVARENRQPDGTITIVAQRWR